MLLLRFFVEFLTDPVKNGFDHSSSVWMEYHVVLVIIIPREYLVEVSALPAERPPIRYHLDHENLVHLESGARTVVVDQDPMLPVMGVVMDMMQPSVIEILFVRILPVEPLIVVVVLFRLEF